MVNITEVRVLFVEDRFATRLAMGTFTKEYPFSTDFAVDFPEFKIKFVDYKPNVVVVDYDLKAGKYHNEIAEIVLNECKMNKRFIGLIGVTALDPYEKIKSDFHAAKYNATFFDNGSKDFFLDLIAEFYKFAKKIT